MSNPDSEARKLPQVDRLIGAIGEEFPHSLASEAARAAIDEARASVLTGASAPAFDELVARARLLLSMIARRRLMPVINATGVLLHTNLGRAPLSDAAIEEIRKVASGYSNLEYDLEKGARGSRYDVATGLLATLTGADAALVVNNNAAAVLLALAALARGREVVISRGELIEIGGGFRIPEILAESGATLIEVGTTNRTHLRDYEKAIGPESGAIMKVHPSNYQVVGFTAAVATRDLARLAHDLGLPLIYDLGSGLLKRQIGGVEPAWLKSESTVAEALADGADIVTFSGDKLLGGPQTGIIVGRRDLMPALHQSPLLRAFRVDKTTLAALEATLAAYLAGREEELPFWSMALASPAEIEARALATREGLVGTAAKLELLDGSSAAGGGSAPGAAIPTVLLEVAPRSISAEELVRGLIDNDPPLVARIEADRVVIDFRTVLPDQDPVVTKALRRLLAD